MIVICGPTCVGKSDLSFHLACEIKGEIINADSMQMYKFLDIGTAKPEKEKREIIPHHIIDIIEPDKRFSAGEFSKLARKIIEEIKNRNKVPIVVGGTGLYIRSLLRGIFISPPVDENIRNELYEYAKKYGSYYLYQMLENVDKVSAKKINPNDIKRIVRALEVFKQTGIPISKLQNEWNNPIPEDVVYIGIMRKKEDLHKRIENRVEKMIEKGLIEEVKNLLDMGYSPSSYGFEGIGYKETIEYIMGKSTLDETIEKIKKNTKDYAKRQMTWFRKEPIQEWINMSYCSNNEAVRRIIFLYSQRISQLHK
jgi:tRNA dimethylallyltransferase